MGTGQGRSGRGDRRASTGAPSASKSSRLPQPPPAAPVRSTSRHAGLRRNCVITEAISAHPHRFAGGGTHTRCARSACERPPQRAAFGSAAPLRSSAVRSAQHSTVFCCPFCFPAAVCEPTGERRDQRRTNLPSQARHTRPVSKSIVTHRCVSGAKAQSADPGTRDVARRNGGNCDTFEMRWNYLRCRVTPASRSTP